MSSFDTNVLVYAFDEATPEKRAIALGLIEQHLVGVDGVTSVQVLRKFYCLAGFSPIPEDAEMVLRAVRRHEEMFPSFWDALIVEAALKAGADRLFTEDLQHGQVTEGMRVENPFL